ncbi:hypothetical protein BDP27DRAFT_1417880 [Rhodocollybia butyracea]|uniref:Uncharacterized protein n=1 Tax=Rhodocollybia butyracea TaxID=206335 RepID=A0A9P5Q0W9_9AGAR|nr:hypothetical protein BDP27DRAFT_1417880 [Rhodocollybia butyracea]
MTIRCIFSIDDFGNEEDIGAGKTSTLPIYHSKSRSSSEPPHRGPNRASTSITKENAMQITTSSTPRIVPAPQILENAVRFRVQIFTSDTSDTGLSPQQPLFLSSQLYSKYHSRLFS